MVKSLTPPPDTRKFKVAGGIRKYKRVAFKEQLQEVIIVAKATKTKKNAKSNEVTDDEIDELEGLEDLDEELEEAEDEDEDEEESDDEDDDDEEEEAPKKGKGKKASSKPKQSQAAKAGFVGTSELAEDLGIDSRSLRMVLRKLREKDEGFAPDSESGRYQWKSLNDPQVKNIKKAIKDGLHTQIKNESLQKLKDKKAAEKGAKDKTDKKSSKKGKKDKKNKKSE